MKQYDITVGTTATLVWKSNNAQGDNLIINTTSTGKDVHFGDSGVNTSSSWGFHLPNNHDAFSITVPYGESLYAAVGTTTGVIHVFEINPNLA
jgi:hypothetical protein